MEKMNKQNNFSKKIMFPHVGQVLLSHQYFFIRFSRVFLIILFICLFGFWFSFFQFLFHLEFGFHFLIAFTCSYRQPFTYCCQMFFGFIFSFICSCCETCSNFMWFLDLWFLLIVSQCRVMLSYVCFLLVFTVTFKLFLLQKVPSIANEQDTSMKSHENPNENLNEIHFGNCKNMIIL